MNFLTGIWFACATVPNYRYASPNGEGCPAAIVHCTLFIGHWTYTFSAKERDSETGLSYFGSRYYSSDLSIWLSVDPMAAKYPHQSNYIYCSNNPIKVVDPNGEDEWEVNQSGYIRHIENNKPDRLYAVCGFGKEGWGKRKTNVEPLKVDKSIIETMDNRDKYTTFSALNNRAKEVLIFIVKSFILTLVIFHLKATKELNEIFSKSADPTNYSHSLY